MKPKNRKIRKRSEKIRKNLALFLGKFILWKIEIYHKINGEAWKIKDFPHFPTVGATAFLLLPKANEKNDAFARYFDVIRASLPREGEISKDKA